MSTGVEKVLPLGSTDRQAGQLETPGAVLSVVLLDCLFPLTCLDQQWRLELGKEGDDLEAKGKDSVRKIRFLNPVRESFLHLFSLPRSDYQPLST